MKIVAAAFSAFARSWRKPKAPEPEPCSDYEAELDTKGRALPPLADRATHERSPQAVSAVPVGIPSAEEPSPFGSLRERVAWQIMVANVPHPMPAPHLGGLETRSLGYYLGVGIDHYSHPWERYHALLFRAADAVLATLRAQGIEARQGGDANAAPSRSDESPVANGDAPKPRSKAHRLAERAMRHG